MPSLKDLRNRIAATKATQKITKAMQMVAASKLRRAQAAAEAARPYAARMDTVLGNIAASVAAVESAPPLLRGTGSDQKHLLLVCTAERIGGFLLEYRRNDVLRGRNLRDHGTEAREEQGADVKLEFVEQRDDLFGDAFRVFKMQHAHRTKIDQFDDLFGKLPP